MVRVGGGWTALDEFLVRHDPCRGKFKCDYRIVLEGNEGVLTETNT